MKPETSEWVAKAEGDFRTACREREATEAPNYDASCFHAQQCVEKYIKARLIEADLAFPKVHDLEALLDLVLPIEPTWDSMRETLRDLTDMGVEVRYPGSMADADDAEGSVKTMTHVREIVRASLGLET